MPTLQLGVGYDWGESDVEKRDEPSRSTKAKSNFGIAWFLRLRSTTVSPDQDQTTACGRRI